MSTRFRLGVLYIPLLVAVSSFDILISIAHTSTIYPFGFHRTFLFQALDSDLFAPFLPIIAVLPMAASYVEDLKSNFVRYSIFRGSNSEYLVSKSISCFLLGGLVIILGVLLSFGICYLVFFPMERSPRAGETLPVGLGVRCMQLFLAGGLWATVGLAMSTIMESKYIAYVSPFIFYYLLVIVYERYFPNAHLLYPRLWVNPEAPYPFGWIGAAVWMLELSILGMLLFLFRGKRRLMEL